MSDEAGSVAGRSDTGGGAGQDESLFDETLAAQSAVRVFGRDFAALKLAPGALGPLQRSSSTGTGPAEQPEPRLARVFGFSFQGQYVPLRAPVILLVHGPGREVPGGDRTPFGLSGVAHDGTGFGSDLRVWVYDRNDLTVRLDIGTGTLQELLIEPEGGASSRRRMDLVGLDSGFTGRGPRDVGI